MYKKTWFLLLIIIIISIFPRAAQLFNSSNYYFGSEQAIEYFITKDIVVDHKIVLAAFQGGFGNILKPAGFNYLLAIPFILADGNPFGGRIFMFLISLLTVAVSFIIFNRMFGLKISFLISFFIAISPSLKDYVGNVSTPSLIPLLTILLLYFLYKSFHVQHKYIPLVLFIVGLMGHFEIAVSGILSVLFMFTAIICIIKKVNIKPFYYILSITSLVIPFLPILVYDIYNNFYNIKGVLNLIESSKNTSISHSVPNIFSILINRIHIFGWDYISSFSTHPIIWVSILILIILGIILFIKDKTNKRTDKLYFTYIAIIPVFTFIFTIFYPFSTIHQWWIGNLNIIYYLLFGVSVSFLWKKNRLRLFIAIIISLLILAFINRTYLTYKTQFAYPPSAYIKEEQVINYIFKDAGKNRFSIFIFSSGSKKTYEYLIWWKGNKIYHYQPHAQVKGVYYNLIDPSFILIYNKQNVQKSLTKVLLIKTIKLPYGYIVEKRLIK